MKRIALLLTAIALTCASANAQSLLERLGQRAKNAAENNVGNKVEQGVNDLLNGKLGKKKDKKDQKQETAQPAQTAVTDGTWTCPNPECGHTGNTGNFCTECGTKKPAGETAAQSAPHSKQVQTAYARTDFVPGDEVFFADDLENEQMGEFPSHWDAVTGTCEVARIEDVPCILLEKESTLEPLMKEQVSYLPEQHTIELDFWMPLQGKGAVYEFMSSASGKRNIYTDGYTLYVEQREDAKSVMRLTYRTPSNDKRELSIQDFYDDVNHFVPGQWNHLALSFNKRALKIYVNGERVANVANCKHDGRFLVYAGSNFAPAQEPAITGTRMAQGAVPLYDRLASDGKIVTYAITFDTGKATLKPEADVEINRIKGIMDKDPSLKFEVQGHCDNTGSDAVNDPLSQKRAEAIVARLVALGIAKDRLTAVGKGSHEPIADNATDEGRAKNRRVEFIKK